MSNRRRLRYELGFELRARSIVSGLQLLALGGCGESSTEVDGTWVDVIVGCADPGCAECASAALAGPLRAATGGEARAQTRGPAGGLPRRGAVRCDPPPTPPSGDLLQLGSPPLPWSISEASGRAS